MQRFKWVGGLVFPVVMSAYMSLLMTGLITWLNTSFAGDFLNRWGHAFLVAWPIAFLLVYFGAGPIRSLSERISKRFCS